MRSVGQAGRSRSCDSLGGSGTNSDVEAEEMATESGGQIVPRTMPKSSYGDVSHKIDAIDLDIAEVGVSGTHLYKNLYSLGETSSALARTALGDFGRRRACSESGLQLSRQERAQALSEGVARARNIWEKQEQELASLPIGGSRAEIDDFIEGVHQSSALRLETNRHLSQDQLEAIRSNGQLDHDMQVQDIQRFEADLAAFSRMQKMVIEMQQLAMEVVQKQWVKARMNQLKVVQETIAQVICERDGRRNDAERELDQYTKSKSLAQARNLKQQETDHRIGQETKLQAHQESVDLENLSQRRATQERADKLADRRLELEEKMEQFRHDLEMRKVEVNKPSFWTRLARLWF